MATILVSSLDEDVRSFALDHRGERSRVVSGVIKPLGSGLAPSVALGLWWAGAAGRAPRLASASRNALEAWVLAGAVVQTGKYSLGRSRPFREDGDRSFAGFALDDSRHSFPSGHVGCAWAVLGAYAMEYDDIPAVSWPLWGAALAVSASRLHDDQHWLSDVVFSMGTGWLSNRFVRAWNGRPTRGDRVGLMVMPTGDGWAARLDAPF